MKRRYSNKYIVDIPRWEKRFQYDELSLWAKNRARAEVMENEMLALERDIKEYKTKGIHWQVNNPYKIPYFIRQKRLLKKLQGVSYMERFLLSNLCEFRAFGEYLYYMKREVTA